MTDTEKKTLSHVEMLDDLIKTHYEEFTNTSKNREKKDLKIGDFIKMVDLRRKLAPHESEQKQFWQMIEDIRREALPGTKTTVASKKTKEAVSKDGAKE